MKGTVVALLGLAILFAIFAGVYYSGPATGEERITGAFQLSEGAVQSVALQPSLPGEEIQVTITVSSGAVDVYTLDSTWSARLVQDGLRLDRPFPYHAQWSRQHVSDTATFTILSDGETWYDVLVDNSDNYYDGDAQPEGVVVVDISARFLAEEDRSLILGYLATVPSVLLVTVLVVRQARRLRAQRADRRKEQS